VVGEAELSTGVAKVAGVAMRAGVAMSTGEESTSTDVVKVADAGVAKVAGVAMRAGVAMSTGEESTSTDVVKVADAGVAKVAGEKLMSASVAAIADTVLVAMDALSASMLACHALQNTATNEQHNPACSRPCTKP